MSIICLLVTATLIFLTIIARAMAQHCSIAIQREMEQSIKESVDSVSVTLIPSYLSLLETAAQRTLLSISDSMISIPERV